MTSTAAIYTRISHDDEQKGQGVERQQELCRELADRLGYEVVAVFEENDISASEHSRKPRPLYADMMRRARAGEFSAVLAYSTSRLTRRRREFLDLLDLVTETGVQVRTVASGDLDLSTAAGKSMAILLANWDASESDFTSERTRAAAAQRAQKGLPNGKTSFGFRRADGRDEVHETEGEHLREVARRVLAGESIRSMAKLLNERGLRTRSGNDWTPRAVRDVLQRPANAGIRMRREEILPRSGRPKYRSVVAARGGAAIWSEDYQTRIEVHLSDPSRKTTRGPEVRHLLSGIAICAECRTPMVGRPGRKAVRASGEEYRTPRLLTCKKCHRVSVNEDLAEEAITRLVLERLQQVDGPVLLAEESQQQEARELWEEIAGWRAKLNDATDKWVEGLFDDEQLERAVGKLRPKIEAGERKARGMSSSPALGAFARRTSGDGAASIEGAWEESTLEIRREILRALLAEIVVVRAARKGAHFTPDRLHKRWVGEVKGNETVTESVAS